MKYFIPIALALIAVVMFPEGWMSVLICLGVYFYFSYRRGLKNFQSNTDAILDYITISHDEFIANYPNSKLGIPLTDMAGIGERASVFYILCNLIWIERFWGEEYCMVFLKHFTPVVCSSSELSEELWHKEFEVMKKKYVMLLNEYISGDRAKEVVNVELARLVYYGDPSSSKYGKEEDNFLHLIEGLTMIRHYSLIGDFFKKAKEKNLFQL